MQKHLEKAPPKEPKKIYSEIIKYIDNSIESITQTPITPELDTNIAQERSKALELLSGYKSSISKSLEDLKRVSEWETFTIAMYGETNAGKSTIIETLRILLGEPLKLESQEKFRQKARSIQLDADYIESLQSQMQQATAQKLAKEQELLTLGQQQTSTQAGLQQAIEQQQALVLHKKRTLGFWKKIVHWFKKLEEEVKLTLLAEQLKKVKVEHQGLIRALQSSIEAATKRIESYRHELALIGRKIEELTPYQDGEIIGTGRSDFTLKSQSYHFEVNGQKFALIDVPGIEGDEKKVSAAIDEAIKKAHAVFYITRKPSPPNKGEAGQPGTVEKIRQHLGSQTEVWAIYNKGITNPMALQAPNLINAGEADSLGDLEKELRSQLGKSYQGCISLSALPAFYASSDCILPTSPHYRSQKKFLVGMGVQELQEKSNFTSFLNFVSQNLCRDHKEKIDKSNKRKIHAIITDGLQMLEGMIDTFSTAKMNLGKQHQSISRELDNLEDSVARRIKSRCHDRLSQAKTQKRQLIYSDIEKDISNDDFKQILKRRIDQLKDELVASLQESLHTEVDCFEAEIKELVTRFLKNADEILEVNINRQFGTKSSFALNFKMDSGINTLGLLSSLGGAAGLIWTAFLASNPAGWTVAVVLGAVTLLFSFVKSVWGFFSSSYKMEQQRKSADENLANVFENIERTFDKRLSEVGAEVSKSMMQIKEQLSAPLHSVHGTLHALQMASKDINQIALKFS
ncbi:MAG: hypothetical protein JSS57_05490 [Proteobacteria bacterium]|nr:hypothetical protein [Pseudomonadota bacterium]